MTNNDQHNKLRKWGARLLWCLAILLVLMALVRLSLKTDFVHQWVKNYAVSTANKQLNADLSIDHLSGDLWEEVKMSGIRLVKEDTLAQIDSVHANYNVWTLLSGKILLSRLHIYQPGVNLRQKKGQWNVQNMAPESEEERGGGIPFQVDDLMLQRGKVSVRSDSMAVDSSFVIDDLELSSSLGFSDKDYHVDLRNLSFRVENTQLQQPLQVRTSASAQKDRITLEKLVFATGNSVIQSSGYALPVDSTLKLDVSASPLAWKDIASYARNFPLRENAKINLSLSGRPEQFVLTLNMEAEGAKSLTISSQFQWRSSLILQNVKAQADYLNVSDLLADTTLPSLEDLDVEFSGRVDLANYQDGYGDLRFSASEVERSPYHLNVLSGKGSVRDRQAQLEIKAAQHQQKLTANIQAEHIWADLPSMRATINGNNVDPSFWMQDSSYVGDLTFKAKASGQGWYPQKKPWNFSLDVRDSHFMGQPIARISASGKVSDSSGNVNARMYIHEGTVDITADLQDMLKTPTYNYSITTRNIDVGPLVNAENFKTAINSKAIGHGRGFDPAKMQLQTSVSIDSSLINNELLRNFSADLSLRDSIAKVDTARLQSTIAEGIFNLRFNILRHLDDQNKLGFDLELKDLDALAPLVGVEDLQAEGNISGELNPKNEEYLRFLGTLDLTDIQYNELFTTRRAQGSLELRMQKELAYLADLDLSSPTFSGVDLQDLSLITQGNYADSLAKGKYEFQFSSPNEGRIEQAGTYALAKDSVRIRTTEFKIISDYRTLALEQPFELWVHNDTLRMDTMRVSEEGGAYLEMGIPIASKEEQRGFVRGQSLNTSVIQNCLLGKSYFKGLLSGQFEISRKDTNMDARGKLLLSEMEYQKAEFDSLIVTAEIMNERLDGTLSAHHQGVQLIDGKADLPFKLGDPETFPPSFFEEPVSGQIRVRDIAIERLDSLFAHIGITQTSGIFSFHGTLNGMAGSPEFTADVSLRDAKLSGVAVDSVTAGVDYIHEDAEIQLDASVQSLGQRAALISAHFPLFIDMKTFGVDLPESQDSVEINIETNNFNLKALNDFLDRRTLRQVTGQLDGLLQIKGKMGDLKTGGKFVLRNGAFRLVPAGIKVDDIESTIYFDRNQIRLTNLSAESGKGKMSAEGTMAIEKLIPGDLELNVKAQNFRLANTSQYNAVVNVDAEAKGSLTKPKVTGSVDVISGFLKLQNFGEKSVESIELDSLEKTGPKMSIYDSLALDMDLSFDRRFYIRNKRYLEMEIELAGELDLQKESGKDLQLFGAIITPNGYARPFGKEFKLEDGTITFSGQPANPQLMVRTRYEPPQTQEDIVIWYVIEGTVEDPKFKYESQPPMELENIISYTLFGQPFYALDSWKQVVASSGNNTTAADVALEVMLDRVEALATQKLGIDVVKIDNSRVGGETGTSITTGWYLNPKVFFAIQNVITGSTPDTGFLLEYKLRKNLELILRQGNGIRQGVDLKWNYDY